MANYKMTNAQGRTDNMPGIGWGKEIIARPAQFTFQGAAAASGDTFEIPKLRMGTTVLDVVVFSPDLVSISVGTRSNPTLFINAKTMTAAGLRLSEIVGMGYTLTIDEPIVITYNAVGASTNGTLKAYVLAQVANA